MIWIYFNEVNVPAASGLIVIALFVPLFVYSLVIESLMAAMNPEGVFFMFGGITLVGLAYIYLFIKDPAGLTDQ